MSSGTVVEALLETSKGRLSYGSQLDNCSSAEKLVRNVWKSCLPVHVGVH